MSWDRDSALTGNSLLSKYQAGTSSLLQSSLLSSGTSSLLSSTSKGATGDYSSLGKHKITLSARDTCVEKKKKDGEERPLPTKPSLLQSRNLGGSGTSSLLGRRPYSSSALQSSLLGPSSTKTDQSLLTTSGSSQPLLSNSGLSSSGLLKSSLLTSSFGQSGKSLQTSSSLLKSEPLKLSLTQDPSKELASSLVNSYAVSSTTRLGSASSSASNRVTGDVKSRATSHEAKISEKKTQKDKGKKSTKTVKVTEKSEEAMQLIAMKRYKIVLPEYDLRSELPMDDLGVEEEDFLPLDKDPYLSRIHKPLHDVNGMKLGFINAVSGSLICQPDFRNAADKTRTALTVMAEELVIYDPEFILKVALYSRNHLNIRTTSNFLLALSANVHPCRPFLKKYYSASINLPTDWIEVAEIYQAFYDKTLHQGSLPVALRKVMIAKFPDFDKYQLAKYNKESSRKKKKKKEKKDEEKADVASARGGMRGGRRGLGYGRGRGRGGRGGVRDLQDVLKQKKRKNRRLSYSSDSSDSESDNEGLVRQISNVVYDEKESEEELSKIRFSLKQLIRKLHIVEPVEHVMSLIGKKYPDSLEKFYQSRLPGTYDEERAGKRMKLPVPETWETQVSIKGNKASTWEQLLDNNKLPFMAMLRNLRNLIKAGISAKHHNKVLRRLTDERSVVNSRQFPFRFFSAYEVLGTLQKDFEESQKKLVLEAEATAAGFEIRGGWGSTRGGGRGRGGRGRGRGGRNKSNPEMWWLDKKKKSKDNSAKETPYDSQLITRYRKALDTAVKIATVYNTQPIKGRTIVLCDIGPSMEVNCTAARGLGKPRQMKEVAVLLGLMCKYSCEECDMVVYTPWSYYTVKLEKGTILENMDRVLNPIELTNFGTHETSPFALPHTILLEALRDRVQIDNLIFLSGGQDIETQQMFLSSFLKKYRELVNSNLLYVNISFAGKGCGFSESIKPEHDNDIYISGYSDQILRFIAEKGDGGQLMHVEKIDEAFSLKPLPVSHLEKDQKKSVSPEKPLPIVSNTPSWRTARVFISSTFRDMHGERDVLTRFVFPELRALAKKHFINVYEVDLRWGVTEEDTRSQKTLELCLTEIQKCQFFLGVLGERYGWTPDEYIVPDTEEFDWVREYPKGASVTELEMYSAALAKPNDVKQSAFFYLRNPEFENEIPKEFHLDFLSEDSVSKQKMTTLKNRIRGSGLEVYDGYPCRWGGVADFKPVVAGLELFASRVLNNLWNSFRQLYIEETETLDENTHVSNQHNALLKSHNTKFVGRKNLVKDCIKHLQELYSGVLVLVGKPGTGKSALMSALVHSYIESKFCDSAVTVLVHIVGAAPGSANILATLRRLCHELKRQFGLTSLIPEDFKNIIQTFKDMLGEAAEMCGSPLVVFIDGLDLMESANQPNNLEWLPVPMPKNVIFVMTALEGGKTHKSLQRHKAKEVTVGALDMWDKAEVVRNTLSVHRKTLAEEPFNNQMKLLLSKREATNPLFLKLACEELRMFGVFEKINSKLKALPHTVPLLLQEVLERLETDLGRNTVQTAMSLLICTRDGLDAEELHCVLSLHGLLGNTATKTLTSDTQNIKLDPDKMIPAVVFSQIKRSLETFLNPFDRWSSRLTLAHAEIEAAVKARYFKGSSKMADEELRLHKMLAGYFYRLADPEGDGTFKGNSNRAFSELPYHLTFGDEGARLEALLSSLNFIHQKCRLGLGSQLLEDYQPKEIQNKTMEKAYNKLMQTSKKIQQYQFFVSRHIHIINSYPALTWQQAINEPSESLPAQDAAMATRGDKLYMEWSNKPEDKDPNYLTLSNLPQPVTVVAISPDNMYFACGGLDCLVRLYELKTGKELRTYRGHSNVISGLCFIDKNFLCSSSHDNTLSIWHVEDGHRVHILKQHKRRVQSVAANPAGKLIASASWDCTVKVWNTSKGEQVCDLKVGSPVNAVSFHPEGQMIVTGSWDTTLKIWDVFHKTRKAVLRGHVSSVRDVAYSPSGRHIASAALDGEVKIWAAHNGTQVGNVQGHSLPINKLIFSPTGKELITVSDDHKVKVFSGHLGKSMLTFGEEGGEPIVSIALSPDGSMVALGYHSGMMRVHDRETGYCILEIKRHLSARIRGLTFAHNGKLVIAGGDDSEAKITRVDTGKVNFILKGHSKPILCVTSVRDYIATGSEDHACYLYASVSEHKKQAAVTLEAVTVLHGHLGPVTGCTFSPCQKKLATASRDASIMIWDIRMSIMDPQCMPLQVLNACHADWITGCMWSNSGDFLVTASNDFTLKVWDTSTGTEKSKMTGHMSSISSVKYKYGCIVSSCNDGSVKVWSHKGTEITTLYGHSQAVNCCDLYIKATEEKEEPVSDISDWGEAVEAEENKEKSKKTKKPDVKLEEVIVATCSADGTARIWKPLQANELANLTGHSDKVLSVAATTSGALCTSSLDKAVKLWAPQLSTETANQMHSTEVTFVKYCTSRSLLITGSRDGVLKIWVYQEGKTNPQCIQTMQAHQKSVNTACFLPFKSNYFVTGGDDGTIILWEIMKKNNKIDRLRKERQFTAHTPVTTLSSVPVTVSRGFVFVSGEWSGLLTVWNTHEPKALAKHKDFGFNDWLLKINFVDQTSEQRSHLVATTANGFISIGSLEVGKNNKVNLRVINSIQSVLVEKDIPDHKRTPTMLLDVCSLGIDGYATSSKGQIIKFRTNNLSENTTTKIHAAPVSSLAVTNDFIFTGSHDQTIKVWDHNLKQIGLFFSPSPVKSLAVISESRTKNTVIQLACGDQLGNLHFLTWRK